MAIEAQLKRSWYKHWWGVLLLIIAVILVVAAGYFVRQFVRYYGLATRGELTTADAAFLDKFTTTDELRRRFEATPETPAVVQTDDDPRMGEKGAPLVVVEFADFGCPWSREESFVIRELATIYADRVLYIYRDFPIEELHPDSRLAAEAGECANEQEKFWAFHDKVYQNQTQLGRADLLRYAAEAGLDTTAFSTCLDSGRYREEVQEDLEAGVAAGVRGTPTFFLNGRRIEGAIPRNVLEQIFEAVTS